jgi:hypothetical protein
MYPRDLYNEEDWLSPLPPPMDNFNKRHRGVSIDTRYPLRDPVTTEGDAK